MNAAATDDTDKSNVNLTSPAPTTQTVNTQKATSNLKIQNVFSMGGTNISSQSTTKEPGQSILRPISMLQNANNNSSQSRQSVFRILNTQSTVTQTQNAPGNMSASSANATVTSATKASSTNPPIIITKVSHQPQKMPVIASIRSYGEAALSKLPVISSIQSGQEVEQSLIDTPTAPTSIASETVSDPVELISVDEATPAASEILSENISKSNGPVEIIDLSDDEDEEPVDEEIIENDDCTREDPLSVGRIFGYIICPTNKDLGKIPAEIFGNSITLKIGSCDKEAELPMDLGGNESFECLNTVDKYMQQ